MVGKSSSFGGKAANNNRLSSLAFGDGQEQEGRAGTMVSLAKVDSKDNMLATVAENDELAFANRISDNADDAAIESFLTGWEKEPDIGKLSK